eukprot:CAMPEP_0206149572 /NCGR_PEP_ID=MMETSP1473-20131121/37853_1 /ASSEMBLY_ACC=CAM_ASM_001109 /TAXON_ID=1461547 /ORGANISM="Stichococcus sp, Strain RCC1054" /LENGTH=79 /DNA_ID=CAMNT_0053547047 /DNA_START=1313 /DNA_END=1552 /DNA_ORIENTATION=-
MTEPPLAHPGCRKAHPACTTTTASTTRQIPAPFQDPTVAELAGAQAHGLIPYNSWSVQIQRPYCAKYESKQKSSASPST